MKFTESLWVSVGDIYDKILRHPFILELTEGTLDEEAFRFYVVQDALYLKDYARDWPFWEPGPRRTSG